LHVKFRNNSGKLLVQYVCAIRLNTNWD